MSGDGAADNTGQPAVGERGAHDALAQALLLEAVDCLRQASDLVDRQECRMLSRHADELAGFASRLPDRLPG